MQNYVRVNTWLRTPREIQKQTNDNNPNGILDELLQPEYQHKEGFIEIMFMTVIVVGIRFALWKFAFRFMPFAIAIDAVTDADADTDADA